MIRMSLALALIAAPAVPAMAQKGNPAINQRMSATTYARIAGASDTYEKESSQLVLANASSPDVRRFAEMMIADHTTTTAALMNGIKDATISAAPRLMNKQAQMMKKLRATPEAKREVEYMNQQVMAHEEALKLHQTYAQYGDQPTLKAAAQAAVPIVQAHLVEAQRIRSTLR